MSKTILNLEELEAYAATHSAAETEVKVREAYAQLEQELVESSGRDLEEYQNERSPQAREAILFEGGERWIAEDQEWQVNEAYERGKEDGAAEEREEWVEASGAIELQSPEEAAAVMRRFVGRHPEYIRNKTNGERLSDIYAELWAQNHPDEEPRYQDFDLELAYTEFLTKS